MGVEFILCLRYQWRIKSEDESYGAGTQREIWAEIRICESSSQGECGVWLMILEGGPVHVTVMGIMEGESGWQC